MARYHVMLCLIALLAHKYTCLKPSISYRRIVTTPSLWATRARESTSVSRLLMGRKIDEEVASIGDKSKKKKKRGPKKKTKKAETVAKIENPSASESIAATDSQPKIPSSSMLEMKSESEVNSKIKLETELKVETNTEIKSEETVVFKEPLPISPDPALSSRTPTSSIERTIDETSPTPKVDMTEEENTIMKQNPGNALDVNDGPIRVPRSDPLKQNRVPPEVVFFGEPRKPPPIETSADTGYHGSLLFWARHATVAPRTSVERLERVFPKGRRHSTASTHRLEANTVTFENYLNGFKTIMDDLEASKDYIASNIDIIPSQLALRAMTAAKLEAQQERDAVRWELLREVRKRYIIAHDQLFFPLNIEVQKAETRVMTYLARSEIKQFARVWDEVEMSLHMTTLISAQITWDERCREILSNIRRQVDDTVSYMSAGVERQLMSKEFRKPGLTSEIYRNATFQIVHEMPDLYNKVYPEVKFVIETLNLETRDILKFAEETFCPQHSINIDLLKERLRLYEVALSSVQGVNYTGLRLQVRVLLETLNTDIENQNLDKWYTDYHGSGWRFDTYEPDHIPTMVRIEQRMRDTGNAFKNFAVQVLKGPTFYTNAFSGKRPKASNVGNWFYDDDGLNSDMPESYEERVENFRKAYIEQTRLRTEAEGRLLDMIENRMDMQDKAIQRLMEPSKVISFGSDRDSDNGSEETISESDPPSLEEIEASGGTLDDFIEQK